ncbi:hypothetical protein HAU32_08465 [Weissella confusa]|uniref:DUF8208 domain-containing protein n=1 Tax=Weissella fermenti TaxID=2987699 RepID=A0ABT6D510_9LACO|nr:MULTISPECIES: hypothetical protein [Weissella]MBJ7689004.1 hypothetical protein [Weissella confusa]MCW0928024.1 hypothetical protein [Weissella sp. LMG 11983]MDF9300614.1 hypothetical protein [Weissella sp. BK2]
MAIGVALMALMMTFYVINALRGAKGSHIRSMLINSMTSLFLMLAVPFIATTTGDMMTRFVLPNISTGSTSNLADVPLRDNTLDLATWATDGFQSQPFASKSPNLNGLDKMGINDIPDFTTEMTLPQINQLNKMVSQSPFNDKSKTPNVKDGDQSQDHVDIKNVGNVFQYKLQASPLGDGTYTLENLDIKDGTFSFAKTRYKRYSVQNIPAIAAFAVIIGVGFLLAIKISRTVIMSYAELIGAFLQAGRDVGSSQPMKQAVMKQLNVALAATVDILMLYLFTQMIGTVPNDVANYVAGLPGGEFARPLAYVVMMAVLGIAAYNGSSVLEKSFGVEAGYQGSANTFGLMTAPGAMLGSFVGAKLANQRLQKRLAELNPEEMDQPGEAPRQDAGFVDQGFDSSVLERDESDIDASGESENSYNLTNTAEGKSEDGATTFEDGDETSLNQGVEDGEDDVTGNSEDSPDAFEFSEQPVTNDEQAIGEEAQALEDNGFNSTVMSEDEAFAAGFDSLEQSEPTDSPAGLENEGFADQVLNDNPAFTGNNSATGMTNEPEYTRDQPLENQANVGGTNLSNHPNLSPNNGRTRTNVQPSEYGTEHATSGTYTGSQTSGQRSLDSASGAQRGTERPSTVHTTQQQRANGAGNTQGGGAQKTTTPLQGQTYRPNNGPTASTNTQQAKPASQQFHDDYMRRRIEKQAQLIMQEYDMKEQQRQGRQQQRAQRIKQNLTQQQKHPLTDAQHHDGKGEVD